MFVMVLNTKAVTQRCFVKVVLQILKIQGEKPVLESLKEETLAQVFSSECSEIYKSTFFVENLLWLLLSIHL